MEMQERAFGRSEASCHGTNSEAPSPTLIFLPSTSEAVVGQCVCHMTVLLGAPGAHTMSILLPTIILTASR